MIQGNKKEIKEMTLKEWTEMMTGTDGQLDKHLLFYCLRTAFAISTQYVASKVRKSINMKRNSINMNFPPKILIKN